MEFKSSFPWSFYVLTAIAQLVGVVFYAHRYMGLFILFALADLYVLIKFIFKTKYIMDARQLTVKKFLFQDEIQYSMISEISQANVLTMPGFGGLYRNASSFNFYKIVYNLKGGSRPILRSITVHPKDTEAFFAELIPHLKDAYISFEYRPPTDEEKERMQQQRKRK